MQTFGVQDVTALLDGVPRDVEADAIGTGHESCRAPGEFGVLAAALKSIKEAARFETSA